MLTRTKITMIAGLLVISAVVVGILYMLVHQKTASSATNTLATKASGCVTQQFAVGSNGHCVNDIQTMVNYMETASLTQCPFPGAAQRPASGVYDSITQDQVKVVQGWFNCYNKEEGVSTSITVDGVMGALTWPELCTYAYKFPALAKQGTSPYFQQTLVAGKDAGCAS